MKRLLVALLALSFGCGTNTTEAPPTNEGPLELAGELKGDTTWEEGSTVVLKESVFVTSGVLTIKPGVTVKGNPGAALVITRDARIDAQGTVEKPIVLTPNKAPGTRKKGDWAGLVLLGKAPINVQGGSQNIEGFAATENRVVYGGTDSAHNCGTIKYARIEFAGFEIAPGKEVNGLTLGGCGSATTIDYVQTHRGSDDGVEVFGGSVNLRHILVSLHDDDGLDWDLGWTGKVQYLIVQEGGVPGNFGFEASSSTAANANPKSQPEIWNITLLGGKVDAPQVQSGIQFKEDTGAKIHRAIIAYFFDSAIDVTGTAVPNANGSTLYVKDSIFFDNAGKGTAKEWGVDDNAKDANFDELAYFSAPEHNNRFVDPLLSAALDETAPKFTPAAGSPALGDASGAPTDPWFEKNGFVGAVGNTDWTAGWTAYPAN